MNQRSAVKSYRYPQCHDFERHHSRHRCGALIPTFKKSKEPRDSGELGGEPEVAIADAVRRVTNGDPRIRQTRSIRDNDLTVY